MKQVLVQKGNIVIEEVPPPAISENEVLVQTHYSLISTGTELAGLSISRDSLLTRAIKQPQNVKKVLKMAAEKGFMKTYKIIKGMLDFGTPTGYSLAGEVVAVGKNITDLHKGDLVACAGAGLANHAEYVAVPRLLVCQIPKNVELQDAASVTLGAIAMQGVRQANLHLGETVAVIGLGLIGQLTCQLLKASGTRVIGIDISKERMELAQKLGADIILAPAEAKNIKSLTGGFGVDATIITASTESSDPILNAMEITRKKGTVVVVGAVGLHLQRSPWYEKEIDLKISCSYGPGRYDATYEEEMLDYPLPYARWTENRNMEEYLRLLGEGKVNFKALATRQFSIEKADEAYECLKQEKPLAVLLSYPHQTHTVEKKIKVTPPQKHHKGAVRLALIGAGSFAATTHLPNLEKLHKLFTLQAIVSKKGLTAKQYAKRYDAQYCTTDFEEVLKDPDVDAVLISTRHHLHASMALAALKAGKAVFVEKPLALNREELEEFRHFYKKNPTGQILMVGFNRRFSPFARQIQEATQQRKNPLLIHYRVNAEFLPLDHWTQKTQGGGRILGEACHFFDTFQFWTGSAPVKVEAQALRPKTKDATGRDNFFATISYEDGSVANLLYTAQGHRDLPKEYAEVYCDGKVYLLDDYHHLTVKGGGGSHKSITQDKGHLAELEAFARAIQEGSFPIPLDEIFSATETCFDVENCVT